VYRLPSRIFVGITRTTGFNGLSLVDKMTKGFLYFAYGSNLLTQRIHINNPSAVRKEIGKLKASSRTQNRKLSWLLTKLFWIIIQQC
jgi:hypothetical protein